jgi:predicted RNA-binding protein with RPS1 domain
MGGGEGAKERRRLKRLESSGGGAEQQKTKIAPFSKGPKRPRTALAKASPSRPHHKFAKKSRDNAETKPATNKNKKKNNVKKPKHLKRKLEQVDDAEKEKLQNELKEWERKKKEHTEKHNKRQKFIPDHPQHSTRPVAATVAVNPQQNIENDASSKNRSPGAPIPEKQPQAKIKKGQDDSGLSSASSSRDSDDSSVEEGQPSKIDQQKQQPPKKDMSPMKMDDPDSDTDSNDDDDNENDELTTRRQRGKRRRGRKDTSQKIEESEPLASEQNESTSEHVGTTPDSTSLDGKEKDRSKKRYCVGRKPVTDFVLGQSYSGKVVYVKPFGVFLDIGCHSDAFCHVSRLSDDYVESPDKLFREGDDVPNARVVEIDRKRKRITVSLQSEARLEDERASMEARQKRKEVRHAKSGKKTGKSKDHGGAATTEKQQPMPATTGSKKVQKEFRPTPPPTAKDPSTMTPAELKRERKLARRAARREHAAEEGQAPQ